MRAIPTCLAVAVAAAIGLAVAGGNARAAEPEAGCCADLDERIAELEATVARKGGRKLSLTISGQVAHAIVGWSDGAEHNAYVVENNNSQNRIGFQGQARIGGDWSAGFRIEFQPRAYRSSFANQLALGASNNTQIAAYDTGSASMRHAHWIIQSARYGQVTVGRNFEAAFGASTVTLVSPDGFAGFNGPGFANGGYFVRRAGSAGNAGLSALTWQNFAYIRNGDGPAPMDYAHTAAHVRYTSPYLLGTSATTGFQVSANWGMDDAWTAALRYAGDHRTIRVAAAAGYSRWASADRGLCTLGAVNNGPQGSNPVVGSQIPGSDAGTNVRCQGLQASGSVLHVPTGLYISGGGVQFTDFKAQEALFTRTGGTGGRADNQSDAWWLQIGWRAKLNSFGNTIFWGQHVAYNTGLGVTNSNIQTVAASDVVNPFGASAFITGSRTTVRGGGVSQEINAANMVLFAGLHAYETGGTLMHETSGVRRKANPIEDFQVYYTGATIRF